MANVKVRRGSEGPAHDPYGVTTITSGVEVVYRAGERTSMQGVKVAEGDAAYDAFTRLTGMSPRDAECIPEDRRMSWRDREACIEADNAMLRR